MVIFLTFPDDPLAVLRTQKMYISLSCFAYIGTCYVNSQGLWEFVGLEWKLGFVLFLDKNCPASTHLEILVNHRCFMNMCIWPKIGVNIVVIRVYIYIYMEHMGMIVCPHSMCVLCLSTICIPKMKVCYAPKIWVPGVLHSKRRSPWR